MLDLSNYANELKAPGLIDHVIQNIIINEALCNVGREGWICTSSMDRLAKFGTMVTPRMFKFRDKVREDLSCIFTQDTIRVLEEYAFHANPAPFESGEG